MKISICISTFNGEKTLKRQLDSIINQTILPNEIVIFDDCSTDKTTNIIKLYKKKYSQINWIVRFNKINVGWKKNFYDTINASSGDYIFLCDQDDYWYNYKIEKMINIMERNENISLLSSNFYFEISGKIRKRKKQKYNDEYEKINDYDKKGLVAFNPGCTYCFRKRLIRYYNKYWNEILSHDRILWTSAFATDSLYMYNNPCINWTRNGKTASAITNSHFSKERFENKILQNINDKIIVDNLIEITTHNENNCKIRYFKKYKKKIELQEAFYKNPSIKKFVLLGFYLKWYSSFKSYLQDLIAFKFTKRRK